MVTAQLVSPWIERGEPTPGRIPKIREDYTLASCTPVSSKPTVGTFANPGKATQQMPVQIATPWGKTTTGTIDVPGQPGPKAEPAPQSDSKVAVIITCEHDIWEKIIHDPEYGPVHWYQEEGREKRIMGG